MRLVSLSGALEVLEKEKISEDKTRTAEMLSLLEVKNDPGVPFVYAGRMVATDGLRNG